MLITAGSLCAQTQSEKESSIAGQTEVKLTAKQQDHVKRKLGKWLKQLQQSQGKGQLKQVALTEGMLKTWQEGQYRKATAQQQTAVLSYSKSLLSQAGVTLESKVPTNKPVTNTEAIAKQTEEPQQTNKEKKKVTPPVEAESFVELNKRLCPKGVIPPFPVGKPTLANRPELKKTIDALMKHTQTGKLQLISKGNNSLWKHKFVNQLLGESPYESEPLLIGHLEHMIDMMDGGYVFQIHDYMHASEPQCSGLGFLGARDAQIYLRKDAHSLGTFLNEVNSPIIRKMITQTPLHDKLNNHFFLEFLSDYVADSTRLGHDALTYTDITSPNPVHAAQLTDAHIINEYKNFLNQKNYVQKAFGRSDAAFRDQVFRETRHLIAQPMRVALEQLGYTRNLELLRARQQQEVDTYGKTLVYPNLYRDTFHGYACSVQLSSYIKENIFQEYTKMRSKNTSYYEYVHQLTDIFSQHPLAKGEDRGAVISRVYDHLSDLDDDGKLQKFPKGAVRTSLNALLKECSDYDNTLLTKEKSLILSHFAQLIPEGKEGNVTRTQSDKIVLKAFWNIKNPKKRTAAKKFAFDWISNPENQKIVTKTRELYESQGFQFGKPFHPQAITSELYAQIPSALTKKKQLIAQQKQEVETKRLAKIAAEKERIANLPQSITKEEKEKLGKLATTHFKEWLMEKKTIFSEEGNLQEFTNLFVETYVTNTFKTQIPNPSDMRVQQHADHVMITLANNDLLPDSQGYLKQQAAKGKNEELRTGQ